MSTKEEKGLLAKIGDFESLETLYALGYDELEEKERRLLDLFDHLLEKHSDRVVTDITSEMGDRIDALEKALLPHFEEAVQGDISRITNELEELVVSPPENPEEIVGRLEEVVSDSQKIVGDIKREVSLSPELVALHDMVVETVAKSVEKAKKEILDQYVDGFNHHEKKLEDIMYGVHKILPDGVRALSDQSRKLAEQIHVSLDEIKREVGRTKAEVRNIKMPRRLS